MPTREAMDSLAHEIIGSYETRAAGLASLRGEVVTQRRATQALIEELDVTHRATARQLRSALAQGRSHLASGVTIQLSQFHAAHHATARQLRSALAQGRSHLASGVAIQLSQLDADRHAMTQQLRSHLTEARRGLVPAEGRRKSQVRAWINEVAATHAGAQEAWQNLTALMQGKRAAASGVVEAPGLSYPAGGPPAGPELAIEIPVNEAAGNGEEDGSLAILADRTFAYLADHPDGARLTELERDLGLDRFQMNRVVKHLVDHGKVEKRDLLYFAV